MSHRATVKTQMKDLDLLEKAAKEVGAEIDLTEGQRVQTYSTDETCNASIKFKDWRYAVAVKADGTLVFDNYNGTWGDIKRIHELKTAYVKAAAKRFAVARRMTVKEIAMANGGTKLVLR